SCSASIRGSTNLALPDWRNTGRLKQSVLPRLGVERPAPASAGHQEAAMSDPIDLGSYGIQVLRVLRNAPPPRLYEEAILYDRGTITSTGALVAHSGAKTGRSPKDKRVVDHPDSTGDIWWGDVNIRLDE